MLQFVERVRALGSCRCWRYISRTAGSVPARTALRHLSSDGRAACSGSPATRRLVSPPACWRRCTTACKGPQAAAGETQPSPVLHPPRPLDPHRPGTDCPGCHRAIDPAQLTAPANPFRLKSCLPGARAPGSHGRGAGEAVSHRHPSRAAAPCAAAGPTTHLAFDLADLSARQAFSGPDRVMWRSLVRPPASAPDRALRAWPMSRERLSPEQRRRPGSPPSS
jgi:hypothetical protein